MPPPSRQELKKLVRKLVDDARPGQHRRVLETIARLCFSDDDTLAAEAGAGGWLDRGAAGVGSTCTGATRISER
ncbi:hypothetical protein FOA52_004256 [Chlamydomonas sp. UWO 241]|nr:hypothetical protein FOA52_004256 [Chlamydomonas sp. UWO 241]